MEYSQCYVHRMLRRGKERLTVHTKVKNQGAYSRIGGAYSRIGGAYSRIHLADTAPKTTFLSYLGVNIGNGFRLFP